MGCRVETPPVPGLQNLDSRTAPVHLLYGAVTVIRLVRDSCFRGALCFEFQIAEKRRNLKRDLSEVDTGSLLHAVTANTNDHSGISRSCSSIDSAYSDHNAGVPVSDVSPHSFHTIVQVLAVQYTQLLLENKEDCERHASPKSPPKLLSSSLSSCSSPTTSTATWQKSTTSITVWAKDETWPHISTSDEIQPTCDSRGKFVEIIIPLHPLIDHDIPPRPISNEGTSHTLPNDTVAVTDADACSPIYHPSPPPLETIPLHPLIASLISVEVGHLLLLSGCSYADSQPGGDVSKNFLDFLSARSSPCRDSCCCCCSGSTVGGTKFAVRSKNINGSTFNEGDRKNNHASPSMSTSLIKIPLSLQNVSHTPSSLPNIIHPVILSITNISTLAALSSSPSLGYMPE